MNTLKNANERNVLVAVDIQNDFISGSLAIDGGEEVVSPTNQLAKAVRQNMGRVAFTRDWHPETTPHFDTWPVHCVAGTDGADFHHDIEFKASDVILSKGMEQTDGYSGYEGVSIDGRTLESMITPQHREKVVVYLTGLAIDYCVKATGIDIATEFKDNENVTVYAVREAMRAVNLQPGDEQQALVDMQAAGVKIIGLNEALAMVEA